VVNRPVNINTGDVNTGNKVTVGEGNRANFNDVYVRGENRKAVMDRGSYEKARASGRAGTRTSDMKNDVLAGKDGSVYKRDSSGRIQQHDGTKWRNTGMSTREQNRSGTRATRQASRPSSPASIPSASTRESTIGRQNISKESASTLQRQYEARDRGTAKTQDFQHRSSGSAARSAVR
jgi:hypothetical protein